MHLSGRHCTNHHGAALRTGVATRIGQHRNKGDKHWYSGKGTFIFCQDASGNHARYHQCHQPEDSIFCQGKSPCVQVASLCCLFLLATENLLCLLRLHLASHCKAKLLFLKGQPTSCLLRLHPAQAFADCLIIPLSCQGVHALG